MITRAESGKRIGGKEKRILLNVSAIIEAAGLGIDESLLVIFAVEGNAPRRFRRLRETQISLEPGSFVRSFGNNTSLC